MIVLASTSATRQAMLRNAGLDLVAIAPQVDERQLTAAHPEWSPEMTAEKLAEAKSIEVSTRTPGAIVIGADQVLALGTRIFNKPVDTAACRAQLADLRGQTHALISAAVCSRDGKVLWSKTDAAKLRMRDFSDEFLEAYLQRNGADVSTSVGGYKIESNGVQLFSEIIGDHFTILGLPLLPLLTFLRDAGEIPA